MAKLLEVLAAGVTDSSGNPLAFGKVYAYTVGTVTSVNIYADPEGTIPNSVPLVLDASGKVEGYITENVRLVIQDINGNTLYDLDSIDTEIGSSLNIGTTTLDSYSRKFYRKGISSSLSILETEIASFIDIDTSTSPITINLPLAANVEAGRFYEFKDSTGTASTNNITINRNGTDTIDGASSLILSTAYVASRVISNGVNKWFPNTEAGLSAQLASKISSVARTYFSVSGTWTKSTLNPKFIKVIAVGGGGGGGGSGGGGSSAGVGSGGGGGGTVISFFMASALGATEIVTIGTGGSGGASASGNGSAGTATSFGVLVTANGGSGGFSSGTKTVHFFISGGTGSSGTPSADAIYGNSGGMGLIIDLGGTDFPAISGAGGASALHGNGFASQVETTSAGTSFVGKVGNRGCGGSGAANRGTTARAGGNGGDGYLIVEEYF